MLLASTATLALKTYLTTSMACNVSKAVASAWFAGVTLSRRIFGGSAETFY